MIRENVEQEFKKALMEEARRGFEEAANELEALEAAELAVANAYQTWLRLWAELGKN